MIIDFDSKNKGGGKEPVVEALNVTANGSYNAPSGVDGYNPVEVNVPQKTFNKTSLTKEYTANGQYSIATPDGFDGISDVSVNVNVASSGGGGKFGKGLSSLTIQTNAQTIDFSNLDTSTFTSMNKMFYNCRNLTSLDVSHFDTSNVTSMSEMFSFCTSLTSIDLSGLNTSNVMNMNRMFYYCSSLTSLDLTHFNTANVTNMNGMFYRCEKLTSLDLSGLNTSNVTGMKNMFIWCGELTSLNISNWNMSKVTNVDEMFGYTSSLETINCDGLQLPNIDLSSIGLNNSNKLAVDSIVGLLNALPTTTNGYSFQIGTDNIAKLSDDQKAIATNKGWTLV